MRTRSPSRSISPTSTACPAAPACARLRSGSADHAGTRGTGPSAAGRRVGATLTSRQRRMSRTGLGGRKAPTGSAPAPWTPCGWCELTDHGVRHPRRAVQLGVTDWASHPSIPDAYARSVGSGWRRHVSNPSRRALDRAVGCKTKSPPNLRAQREPKPSAESCRAGVGSIDSAMTPLVM
jgi:hypothetical protein